MEEPASNTSRPMDELPDLKPNLDRKAELELENAELTNRKLKAEVAQAEKSQWSNALVLAPIAALCLSLAGNLAQWNSARNDNARLRIEDQRFATETKQKEWVRGELLKINEQIAKYENEMRDLERQIEDQQYSYLADNDGNALLTDAGERIITDRPDVNWEYIRDLWSKRFERKDDRADATKRRAELETLLR